MSTMQPIRDRNDIKRLKNYFLEKGELRNYAIVAVGINLPVRISDMLHLKWDDVYDFQGNRFRLHVTLLEKKTGKKNTMALNECVIEALQRLADEGERVEGQYIFKAHPYSSEPLTRVAAYLVIRHAAEELGLESIGCHSLRKTFGYHAWKSGVHLAVLMAIYNHSSLQVTKRYLGIEQDDKDEVMKQLKL